MTPEFFFTFSYLCHLFPVGFRVEWGLCKKYRVLLWCDTELIVECVMPDFLHVIPVCHDAWNTNGRRNAERFVMAWVGVIRGRAHPSFGMTPTFWNFFNKIFLIKILIFFSYLVKWQKVWKFDGLNCSKTAYFLSTWSTLSQRINYSTWKSNLNLYSTWKSNLSLVFNWNSNFNGDKFGRVYM